MKSISDIFKNRVILLDVLAILFGISSWVTIDGVWQELPIMTGQMPEQWKLASYIVIIVQLANFGPITYGLLKRKFSIKSIEGPSIHAVQLLGAIACLLLVFFWDSYTEINGQKHSLAFFILTGVLAMVDTTTTVLYMPFMTIFKPKYLMSLMVGESLSGSVPSVIALIQGISADPVCVNSTKPPYKQYAQYAQPSFTVSIFYVVLLGVVLVSWVAFTLLYHLKRFHTERVSNNSDSYSDDRHFESPADQSVKSISVSTLDQTLNTDLFDPPKPDNIYKILPLLVTQAFICSLANGILPSIASYSTAPYGFEAFHYSVTLTSIINPLGCFIAFNISHGLIRKLLPVLVPVATVAAICLIVTARLSPTPPLYDSTTGKVLIVFIGMICKNGFSFSRACIAALLRHTTASHSSLYMCGVFTQIGSAIGATIMFFVVNYGNYFLSYDPCS